MNPQFVAVAQLGFTLDRADEARQVGPAPWTSPKRLCVQVRAVNDGVMSAFDPQSKTSVYRRFVP